MSALYLVEIGFAYRKLQKQQTDLSISKERPWERGKDLNKSLEEKHNKHMDGRREEGNYRTRQQGEWDGEKKERKHERVVKVKVFEKNSVREQGEFGEK